VTHQWPDERVVCSHGLDGVPPKTIEIFTFAETQDKWVPTVAPHCLQQIRGRQHDAAFDADAGPLRFRYSRPCQLTPCRAQFIRLEEHLQAMLFDAAARGQTVIDIKPGPTRRAELEAARRRAGR
jgi:hypothetical protein